MPVFTLKNLRHVRHLYGIDGCVVPTCTFADPQPWLSRAKDAGAFTICQVQSAELAELAEQIEALVAAETADASGVRLGRRLATFLTPDEAKDMNRSWLEGCIWAAARHSGLDWDQWRCAAAAEVLRSQRDGWEAAMVRAIGGTEANPSGA